MIFFASTNQHKINELKKIINMPIKTYKKNESIHIDETGLTFEENALIKARANYKHFKIPVICEDSGLTVIALNGKPGVFSRRYAGENATDSMNIKKVLKDMKGIRNRNAYFNSTFIYYDIKNNEEIILTSTGELWGTIALKEAGLEGFGYDSIFIPENNIETLAQLGNDVKNYISHRRKAIELLKKKLYF